MIQWPPAIGWVKLTVDLEFIEDDINLRRQVASTHVIRGAPGPHPTAFNTPDLVFNLFPFF